MLETAGGGAARRSVPAVLLFTSFILLGGCDDTLTGRLSSGLEVSEVVDFGAVSLSRGREKRVRLTNLGRAPLRIEELALEQPSGLDWAIRPPSDLLIEGGRSLEVPVGFAPVALGQRRARLLVRSDSEQNPFVRVTLTGEGILGEVEVGANVIDFGKVALRTTATLPLPLKNASAHPAEVFVSAVAGDDAEEFRTSPSGEFVVPTGVSRPVDVHFAPQRIGHHEALVEVKRCPSCDVQPVILRGEGIVAALVADPREVDFGFVEPGQSVSQEVRITNLGTKVAVLHSVGLGQSSAQEFTSPGIASVGVQLAEGESVTVTVSFSPTTLEPRSGSLRIEATTNTDEVLVVPLKGHGGGPEIEVRPETLGFPRTGVGLTVEKKVQIWNVGHDPTGTRPLRISAVYIDGATSANGGDFTVTYRNGQPTAPRTLQPGELETLHINYRPSGPGAASAMLHIESNDGDESLLIVPITASAVELGPCTWQALPEQLDFGAVSSTGSALLSFAIRNVGPNPCGVANIRLSRSTPPVFSLDPLSSRIIDPGDHLVVPVRFTPSGAQSYAGLVEFDVTSPSAPRGEVRLSALGVSACLELSPQTLDFGTVGLSCMPPVRAVMARNACAFPVEVHSAWLGTSVSEEFSLQSGGGQLILQPGEERRYELSYAPEDEGHDDAPFFVSTSLFPTPLLVDLQGVGALRPTATDTFVQPPRIEVDVLFVIDNSGSLLEEQEAISRNFDRFIQSANARRVDYRIAVTTTGLTPYKGGWADCPGGADGGEAGRFFPVDNSSPRILTPTTPGLREAFAKNVKVGVCHWLEEGLEASRLALSPPLINALDAPNFPQPNDGNAGFLRPEAKLYVLWVTDEDDGGKRETSEYVSFLRGLKPGRPDLVSASAIVGMPSCLTAPKVGTRYMEVVDAMGGMLGDICSPDWGGLLQRIGEDAFNARLVFPLTQAPDGRDIVVTIDGNEIPANASNGAPQWRFDPTIGDYGAVVFEPGHAPGPNTTLEITYPVPCPPASSAL